MATKEVINQIPDKKFPETDPNKVMERVFLPNAREGEEQYVRVGMNGKVYQVPRGKPTMVPRFIFDILRQSEEAHAITLAYDDAHREIREDRRG